MQMQAMNQYGNQRGFGGPPQPQRQGGRRGNNRGGAFRGNSRFDQNQRSPVPNQGGQRPPNESTGQNNQAVPEKPVQPQIQQTTPQAQQKPPAQQVTPKMDSTNQQSQPQLKQQPPQNAAQNTAQNAPQIAASKPEPKDQVDQGKPLIMGNPMQQQQHQKNANANFGGNKQDGNYGGTKQDGNFGGNKHGGNFGGNKQDGNFGGNKQDANFSGNKQDGNFGGNKQDGNFGGNKQDGNFGGNKQDGNFGGNKQDGNFGGNKQDGNFGGNKQDGNFGGYKQGGWNQGGNANRQGVQGPKPFQKQGGAGGGPARNQRNPNMRGQQLDGGKPVQREEAMLANKLKDLAGPLLDLPPIDQPEVKFNGRSRLYIGNFTSDVTEEEILKLFAPYGETSELFINKEKNFGFIKLDYRMNAEKAKRELDGKMRNGRSLRVRFAPHNSAVRVKNLPPFVSNELLYRAFEIFGKIERAYVKVDERGKTLGEGVVEYARKPSALAAIRNCSERCFFLTSSLRPVIVEAFEEPDEFDGFPEKNIPKRIPEFIKAREIGPRFSEPNSFEHEYGTRWKQLHELHRQKEEALKKELLAEEEKLEAQMEYAKYEHETELLRAQLRQREQDRERQKRSWEMAERAADERREAERAHLQRQEEELAQRMRHQDDELRRRQQENTLFVQAQRLNSMLDRQEQGMFDQQQPMDGGFREEYDMPRGYDDAMQQKRGGWEGPRQMDDFPNKRRRY